MPLRPQLSNTSLGPSAPHVAVCITPPNATAGANTAKYRNKQAPALFAGFRNPSNQSWAYSGDRFRISSLTPWSHVFRLKGFIRCGLAPASPTGNSVDASKVPVNLEPVLRRVDAPVQPTGITTPLSYNCRDEPSFPTNTSGNDTLPSLDKAVTARTSVSLVDAALGTVNSFRVCWGSSWMVARRRVLTVCEGSGGRYPCTATASAAMHACGRMVSPLLRCGSCSAWCSPVSLLLFAIRVSSDARCSCARWSTRAQRSPAYGPACAARTAVQFARSLCAAS